jgi:CxxC-x17-CxxC domain-containing protein
MIRINRGDSMSQKKIFEAKCTDCGKIAMVPFKPTAGKPVYCRTCFSKHISRPTSDLGMNNRFDPKQAWARRGEDWCGRNEEPTGVFQRY